MCFAASGVEISPLVPVASAFVISLFCSAAGISGAFLLLPFQMDVLGYTTPGVSATNQIFNILACPAGVYRFAREGRMLTPLALFMAAGTLPGVFLGAILRLGWLADMARFKLFVAVILLYIASRMALNERRKKFRAAKATSCQILSADWRKLKFSFQNEVYEVSGPAVFMLSLFVGIIGGVYGVGGGAILSPFLVAFFGLPVYAIAGACLFSAFLTSIAGTAFYYILAIARNMPAAAPDWALGALFGLGGMCGMYIGAAAQKFIPARIIRIFLICLLLGIAIYYLFM